MLALTILALLFGSAGLIGLFVDFVVVVCLALLVWYCVQRFSPDPLLTKIVAVFLFLLVFLVIVASVFPGSVNLR